MQTTVTAYFLSKQLMLFAYELQNKGSSFWDAPTFVQHFKYTHHTWSAPLVWHDAEAFNNKKIVGFSREILSSQAVPIM